ncbi:MAG TPA: phosphotransferase [Acidimicrobiales bacterium]|nr:phosphotransferase [Acidimicrobiales bacterium]
MGRAIPTEVGDLDAGWFTEVLRTHAPDVEVAAAEVVDAHSGTTGRVKVRLEYAGSRGDLPGTVFCKIAPFEQRQRAFLRQIGIGAMEARFYAEIAPHVGFLRYPRVWHAETDDDGGFVMVLEDLDASGCTFPRPSDPDVAGRAASTVEELARLHGALWMSPRLHDDLSWVPTRAGFGSRAAHDDRTAKAAAQFVRAALDRFADDQSPGFRAVGTLYAERTADILDLFDQGERTLVHGDPHSGNLFTDAGRTGFFDWAMFSRSPGMRDVAYYCCNSLPTEVRRDTQGALVDRYRAQLARVGVDLPGEVAERQLRLFAVYSWVSATSTAAVGGRWQPPARAIAAMERTTAAVEDLDSVGLLREML